MNPIQHALNQCIATGVPREVLMRAFYDVKQYNNLDVRDLFFHLQDQVIYRFLLPAMNVVGGNRQIIELGDIQPEIRDRFTRIYRIPMSMTQGRSIVSALSVSYGAYLNTGSVAYPGAGGSQLLNSAQQLVNSVSAPQINSTDQVALIGENVIMIRDAIQMFGGVNLECYIEHDKNLAGMNIRAYQKFTEMVILAVKAYIFNKLRIQMDMGFIHAGHELGAMRDVIMEYSDSHEELMRVISTDWARVSKISDWDTHKKHINMQFGFGI